MLDGEALGVLDDGTPRRFQDTMGDFGAEAIGGRGNGLRAFFFDILHVDGSPVHDEPLSVRRELLQATVPTEHRLPSIVTADAVEAEAFLQRSIAAGHEGVMVKGLDRPYEAGRRGSSWRKVKPVYTLDLVVLAVEWGHGRRVGWLSNLHLGARSDDPADEASFVMVGKTFKGHDRRPVAMADRAVPRTRDRPRRPRRPRPPRAGRRDRRRRRAGVDPLSGRRGPAVRQGEALPHRQVTPPTPTRSTPSAPSSDLQRRGQTPALQVVS